MRKSFRHELEDEPTALERVLWLHGQFRRCLEPIGVTPLQAGVLLHVYRHQESNMTNTAAALGLRRPTLTEVIDDLVRKRWVTRRRSTTDTAWCCCGSAREGAPLSSKSRMAWDKSRRCRHNRHRTLAPSFATLLE
jgi:hypothetical protein